ncbi:FecR domain-containing protein [Stenotrophomonas sp. LGBM10]|uniref:FecR domain-containing protein n=1 Tax=Stenotrophomonas sp. LGBM10 TaxID=3390038 RepID=UPI00398BAC5E
MTIRGDYDCLQQAAHWFAELQDGDATPAVRQQWQHWLHARAEHQQAWEQVQQIWSQFATLSPAATEQALASASVSRRRALRRIGGTLGLGTAALFGLSRWHGSPGPAMPRTAFAAPDHWALPDGATLWLNGDSAADIAYGSGTRRLVLRHGELLVQTAADTHAPPRPFEVHTPCGTLLALGTRFSVWLQGDAVLLSVFDGAVVIQPDAAPPRRIDAGQQCRFDRHGSDAPRPADAVRESWVRDQLLFQSAPLATVVAELGRYRRGYLGCDPAIAALPVLAALPLRDSDRALALVAAALPVEIERPWPWWTRLRPR